MKKEILLDPGHGGKDPGAVGAKGLKESNVTLSVAKLVQKKLKPYFKVLMTRTNDVYVDLDARWKMANFHKVDACVCIHMNSATDNRARGLEVYIRENANPETMRLADMIHFGLVKASETIDRGIKIHNFDMTAYPKMPCCLVECEFISNPSKEKLMSTSKWKNGQADAIANAIISYFHVEIKKSFIQRLLKK